MFIVTHRDNTLVELKRLKQPKENTRADWFKTLPRSQGLPLALEGGRKRDPGNEGKNMTKYKKRSKRVVMTNKFRMVYSTERFVCNSVHLQKRQLQNMKYDKI